MASYVVTGASRGLGFAFLSQLAKNPSNTVIGIVRNQASAQAKLHEAGLKNVNLVEGDIGDLKSMQTAAEAVAEITGGGLDVLINNAAFGSAVSEFKSLADFDASPEIMVDDLINSFKVNTVGLVHAVQSFIPLIRQGTAKKIINISTGMADVDLINSFEVDTAAPYSVSKGASNVIIAKYNAAYGREGILFLSISPGYVTTERNAEAAARTEGAGKMGELAAKFAKYAPQWKGPLTPEESVLATLRVIDSKSVENGDGGKFVSHLGTQQWL